MSDRVTNVWNLMSLIDEGEGLKHMSLMRPLDVWQGTNVWSLTWESSTWEVCDMVFDACVWDPYHTLKPYPKIHNFVLKHYKVMVTFATQTPPVLDYLKLHLTIPGWSLTSLIDE